MLKRLKELREYGFDYEIQQREIADLLNITQPAYSQLETGDRRPTFKQIYILANYYHVNIDYILELGNKKKILNNEKLDIVMFGQKLKDFRINELKISQAKMSKDLNVSQDTIAVCERGERLIPIRCAINIGKKYKLSLDYLCNRSDNKFIS